MGSNAMRQLEERHMANKVDLMVWSNKMDLIALSNSKGEVSLHRLSWLKVWSLAPPMEGVSVKGLAWRPDGKVLSIAYDNNEIYLVDVENKDILYKSQLAVPESEELDEISCILWIEEKQTQNYRSKYSNVIEGKAEKFLPPLPPITRSFSTITEDSSETLDDIKKIVNSKTMNFLIVGTNNGYLSIHVFGLFSCGMIQVRSSMEGTNARILSADLSTDLKHLYIVTKVGYRLQLSTYNTGLIADHHAEIHALAYKHGVLLSLIDYLDNTVSSIMEAYENMAILEMESKLSKYAESLPEGTVSAYFLELLLFGVTCDSLTDFLLKQITGKGVKKLGHSIELNHSNIQKLILKHLSAVSTNLAYHLSEIRGMAKLSERFSVLGLDESNVRASFQETGSFLVKAMEVQLIIEESLMRHKAFFKWLHASILRINDDKVGESGLQEINQQEISFIAEYLYNFEGPGAEGDDNESDESVSDVQKIDQSGDDKMDETSVKSDDLLVYTLENESEVAITLEDKTDNAGAEASKEELSTERRKHYYLDKLNQYLSDRDLIDPIDVLDNPWEKLLEDNPNLAEHPSIIHRRRHASLIQQHKLLKNVIKNTFASSEQAIASHLKLVSDLDLCFVNEDLRFSMMYTENRITLALIPFKDTTNFTLIDINLSANSVTEQKLYFGSMDIRSGIKTVDLQFYTSDIISVLLEDSSNDDKVSLFVQFPLRCVQGGNSHILEVTNLLEPGSLRPIENMVASRLAVSGNRKVAVVLSDTMHIVRTYEMEVEEDEEEDEMESTRESDNSSLQQSV